MPRSPSLRTAGRRIPGAPGLVLAAPALATLILVLAALAAIGRPAAAAPDQAAETYFLPIVQSSGYKPPSRHAPQAPAGMEGFGDTTIQLQSLDEGALTAALHFRQFDLHPVLERRLAPRAVSRVVLTAEEAITLGYHSAWIEAGGPLGVLAQTRWDTGARVAYEAAEPGTELILPLNARNVLSYTTSFVIQNTSDEDTTNEVDVELFDPRTGGLDTGFRVLLEARETAEYDLMFDPPRFGHVANNVGTGYLGMIRLKADFPVAALAFGDELQGEGASAVTARPHARADRTQYLPLVRANYVGDSLIAISSRETSPIQVRIRYRGAPGSPTHAGAEVEQRFDLVPRGTAYIDLGTRGRGTVAAPAINRGSQANRGFYGSAIVEAEGRVLATVLDSAGQGTVGHSDAAYNGFGPADLGTLHAVATVRRDAEARSFFLIQSPAGAELTLRYTGGGSEALSIPAGEMRLVGPAAQAAGGPATIASSSPVAVLVYEAVGFTPAEWPRWGQDASLYWANRIAMGELPTPASPTPRAQTPSPTASPPAATTPPPSPTEPSASATPSASPPGPTTPSPSPPATADPGTGRAFLPAALKGAVIR